MGRLGKLSAIGIAMSLVATACGSGPGTHTETCVDWVRFENPQAEFEKAGLVVVGKPLSRDGETTIYGYKAQTHSVEVEKVLKGNPGGRPLRISSMPQTCTNGESYPNGDPLDTDQRVLIFASRQDSDWITITPDQGVLLFKQGTEIPFKSVPPSQ